MPEQRTTARNDLVPRDLFQAELDNLKENAREAAATHRRSMEKELAYLKEQTALHFRVLELAHSKSDEVLNERLQRMNEFREAMNDQAGRFVTRTELNLVIRAVIGGLFALVMAALSVWAMFR